MSSLWSFIIGISDCALSIPIRLKNGYPGLPAIPLLFRSETAHHGPSQASVPGYPQAACLKNPSARSVRPL
jgi:hypothetical protein